jgi:hypothetical protein
VRPLRPWREAIIRSLMTLRMLTCHCRNDAIALFERLLALRNDLGLLAEEYDPLAKDVGRNSAQRAFRQIGAPWRMTLFAHPPYDAAATTRLCYSNGYSH